MKNKFITGALLLCLGLFLASCASAPAMQKVKVDYTIVDTKGAAMGITMPPMFQDLVKAIPRPKFESKHFNSEVTTFSFQMVGKNLRVLEMWAKNFDVIDQIAKYLTIAVDNVAQSQQQAGVITDNELQATTKINQKVSSEVSFSGLRQENDWWIKRRHKSIGKEGQDSYKPAYDDFQYFVIYAIENEKLAVQLEAFFKRMEKALMDELGYESRESVESFMQELRNKNYGIDGLPTVISDDAAVSSVATN